MAFSFENLEVWKKAVSLNGKIISIVKKLPNNYVFTIGSNLIRASLSISNNIAEGSGRKGFKEAANFYNIAKGSVYETVNVLIILRNESIMEPKEFDEIYIEAEEIAKMLTGLMKSIKK